jgi:hypothetical protein
MAAYGPVHILPYDPQCHELFAIYRQGPVHITSSLRFTIMTSNLFPVSSSLYFGRKLGLFLEAKYNITNSSQLRFGPYNILWVTSWSINCHMALSTMNYLLNIVGVRNRSTWRKPQTFRK